MRKDHHFIEIFKKNDTMRKDYNFIQIFKKLGLQVKSINHISIQEKNLSENLQFFFFHSKTLSLFDITTNNFVLMNKKQYISSKLTILIKSIIPQEPDMDKVNVT